MIESAPMFEDANEFSIFIEKNAFIRKCSVIDVILEFCEENFIDPSEIAKLVNKSLRNKIELGFIEMNYLPKQSTLDTI